MAPIRGAGFDVESSKGKRASRPHGRNFDQSVEDAFRAVDASEEMFVAAARNAFGERNDPLRTYGEAFVRAGAAQLRAIRALNESGDTRYRAFTDSATRIHHVDPYDLPPVYQPTDTAAKSKDLSSACFKRALGWIASTIAVSLSLGVAVGCWLANSEYAATARLAELRAESIAVMSTLTQAQAGLSSAAAILSGALGSSQSGLSIIHHLSTLPDAERSAAEDIISDMALRGPSASLVTIRDFLRIPPNDRETALSFAQLGDTGFRDDFLTVARLASRHARFYFYPGERNYAGCVTNGPVLQAPNKARIRTCLIEIPQTWAEPDTLLRRIYTGE